jgi:hypothetical protein
VGSASIMDLIDLVSFSTFSTNYTHGLGWVVKTL